MKLQYLGIAAVTATVIFSTLPFLAGQLAGQLLKRLPVPATPGSCDAIVVLGYALDKETGNVGTGGLLERRLRMATEAALSTNPAGVIEPDPAEPPSKWPFVLSGGIGPEYAVSEAAAMYKWLVNSSVYAELELNWDFLLEDSSTSTRTNAVFSMGLLSRHMLTKRGKVCVVTNDFHQWRSLRTFSRAAVEFGRFGWSFVPVSSIGDSKLVANFEEANLYCREIAAIAYYALRGWL